MASATVRRKYKRRSARPITLQALMRVCAWPVGEDTEIRLWLRTLRTMPFVMLCISVALLVCWKTMLPVRVHAADILSDPVTLFWWDALCEDTERLAQTVARDTATPNDARSCGPLDWLLPAVAALLAIPIMLF